MGCWNHTCAITNLPILRKEEVEVIFFKGMELEVNESACYRYIFFTPIPFTFSGVYDEYGRAEDCEGAALDIIIEGLRETLCEIPVDEESRHDDPVTKEDFNVETLFQYDHEGRLYIENPLRIYPESPAHCRIRHIVVRKDVYEGIVTQTRISRWWDDEDYTTLDTLDVDVFTNEVDEFNALETDDIKKMLRRIDKLGESETAELLGYDGIGVYGMNLPINVVDTLIRLREEKSDLYDGVLNNAVRFAFFNKFMDNARKTWTIPSGMGSQDEGTWHQELCAKLTLSEAEKIKHRWDDE